MINQKGFSVIEVIIAAAIFVIFASGIAQAVLGGFGSNRQGEEQTVATQFASEGIEAAKSIKNQDFVNLVNSAGTGITQTGGVWTFSGSNNQFGPSNKYTRVIKVEDVQRDGSGNIVTSGGTLDSLTKKITATVTWLAGPARSNSVVLSTYLSDFRKSISTNTGMLIYGDGGTTTDAIKYKTFNGASWSTSAATADIDALTGNKVLYAARLYNYASRSEKILVSRHYDGSNQYIYAQVWNGSTWGNVQLLSSFASNANLNVRNFDGTYLASGNFMVVYSDNTSTPKMRIWDGSSWSSQSSLTVISNTPIWIRISARPTTNEVMAAFLDSAQYTQTEYWSGSAWGAVTVHSTSTFNIARQGMDFKWSTFTPTIGVISYQNAGGDKTPRAKLFQANGSGGGSWGTGFTGVNIAAGQSMVNLVSRNTANEFSWCNKDSQATPDITCRKITFSGLTGTFTTTTNPILVTSSVDSVGMSFGQAFESVSADLMIAVYSDNTNVPKLKKYNASTSTWDASATNVSTSPYTLGSPVQTVEAIPNGSNNDLIFLMTDNNLDLYSVIWDGTNNVLYTSPAGVAFLQHGINGAMTTSMWYSFVWDQ